MAEAVLPISTDEDFLDLTPGDKTAVISGYICQVRAVADVGEGGRYRLLKFTLTNGTKKLQCCIWGQESIEHHQHEVIMYNKLVIKGAHCKTARLSYAMENENYVPIDLAIQLNTRVTSSGLFEPEVQVPEVAIPEAVTFDNIHQAEGLISIHGFIRTNFAVVPSRFQNATYGCGSITNGAHKITVNITNFAVVDDLHEGVAVTVVGTIDKSHDILAIICRDMTAITRREDVADMAEADLLRGGKTLKRRAPIG